MNTKLAQNQQQHEQTVEVPQPLEIHPSIPEGLANRLLEIADLFTKEPLKFVGSKGYLKAGTVSPDDGCGCIIAHLAGNDLGGLQFISYPDRNFGFREVFKNIYDESSDRSVSQNPSWAIARIETFLRTAQ